MERFLPALKKRMKNSPLKDVPLKHLSNIPNNFSELVFTPDVAEDILGYHVEKDMKFYEVEKAYHNNYPKYKK
jgi:hypothetical protein